LHAFPLTSTKYVGEFVLHDCSTGYQRLLGVCVCRPNATLAWNPEELSAFAKTLPGVECLVTYQDIKGANQVCAVGINDEPLFATDHVSWVGQMLGVVVADSHDAAARAAKILQSHIKYTHEKVPLVSTRDAVTAGSFFAVVWYNARMHIQTHLLIVAVAIAVICVCVYEI
jgi:xanthine dehydrogenase/oxidase